MDLPGEVGVITLPNAILFPDTLLPLHIFEPRYRRMLSDSLRSHRMFAVAFQKAGAKQERPARVACLGFIRVCVTNDDGTSNLILQGITRIRLGQTLRYRPYRLQRFAPLKTVSEDSIAVDALSAKVLELVAGRLNRGFHMSEMLLEQLSNVLGEKPLTEASLKQNIHHLVSVKSPDQMADLISLTFLSRASERQKILESLHVQLRLKRLIQFLIAEEKRLHHN